MIILKTLKLSLVNVLVLSLLVFALALTWNSTRQVFFSSSSVYTFQATDELFIYPAVSASKSMTKAKTIEKVAPVSKAGPVALPIVPPRIMFQVMPVYPSSAINKGYEGVVLLRVHVSEAGEAKDVEIKASSGYASLDKSAEEAAASWEFEPAKRGTVAIASWFEVPVSFRLR